MRKKLFILTFMIITATAFLCACGNSNGVKPTATQGVEEPEITGEEITATPEPTAAVSEEIQRSLSYLGNTSRLKKFIEKASSGEAVTVACIGGSITYGEKVKKNECYVTLFRSLIGEKYSNSNVKLVNAGLPGTPSTIGLMRLQTEVLSKNPDLIVVEFAVNDSRDTISKMMYDSLIRQCLTSENAPAVIILLTVTRSGYSCEDQMTTVAKAYEVPVINVKSAIWPEITAGNMTYDDYSGDDAHPNASGHKRIIEYFSYLFDCAEKDSPKAEADYSKVYAYSPDFAGMNLYTAKTLEPDALGGFKAAASGVGSFAEGWAWTKNSEDGGMTFTITGKDLFLLYVSKDSAKYGAIDVFVDGEYLKTVNANDPEGWGGAEYVTLINRQEAGTYTVELRTTEESVDKTFQIIGLATTGEIAGGHLIPDEELPYTERAIVSMGNTERLRKLFERAEAGEELTIGFIGGSITMGSGASNNSKCYAKLVFDWFVKTFPKAKFTMVNAGIGATDSRFGCARVESDLLQHEPDFVIVEFSVNDESSAEYKDSYESLVRTILESNSEPAVVVLNMVQYDSGNNAQTVHNMVAKHYGLPIISMKNSIYKEITLKRLTAAEVSDDNTHPNDRGHAYACEIVTYYLEKILALQNAQTVKYTIPESTLTEVSWTNAVKLDNTNSTPELSGFSVDSSKQNGITDVFKNGFYARKADSSITFTVTGQSIYIQYRKSNTLGAPKALVIIDGDESKAIEIDGNFPDGWGNWLKLEQVYSGSETQEHTVEIRITEDGTKQDLYIVGVIVK